MIFGFFVFNIGLTFILDTNALVFSLGLVSCGIILFFFGCIESVFIKGKLKKNSKNIFRKS